MPPAKAMKVAMKAAGKKKGGGKGGNKKKGGAVAVRKKPAGLTPAGLTAKELTAAMAAGNALKTMHKSLPGTNTYARPTITMDNQGYTYALSKTVEHWVHIG